MNKFLGDRKKKKENSLDSVNKPAALIISASNFFFYKDHPIFNIWLCCLLAVSPWASYITSLCLPPYL